METKHINIKQFIDKNTAFASSITVDWCGVNFTMLPVENSITPDGRAPKYSGSSSSYRHRQLKQKTIICWRYMHTWE